jgi:hypothetical protein
MKIDLSALIETYPGFQLPDTRKDVIRGLTPAKPHQTFGIESKAFVLWSSGRDEGNSTVASDGLRWPPT